MYDKWQIGVLGTAGTVASFFAPLPLLIFWLFMFVIIDTITGMMAAHRRGEELTSHKLKRVISKLICYMTVIILARAINFHILPFVELKGCYLASGIVCFVELFSILENMYSITGNQVFKILTQWGKTKMKETTGVSPE